MEREWSFYGGGQFNGGRNVTEVVMQFNRGNMML